MCSVTIFNTTQITRELVHFFSKTLQTILYSCTQVFFGDNRDRIVASSCARSETLRFVIFGHGSTEIILALTTIWRTTFVMLYFRSQQDNFEMQWITCLLDWRVSESRIEQFPRSYWSTVSAISHSNWNELQLHARTPTHAQMKEQRSLRYRPSLLNCPSLEWQMIWVSEFHCFTMHFNSLCVMVQLMHLFVIKH
jgi:hypothetical protein